MKKRKFHIVLAIVSIWNFSWGQQYTNYTVNDGLPSNHVYQLTQDNSGFIWMVTDKGIVKYNGRDFKTFTTRQGLPTNDIWGIRTTPDDKVWYFSKSPKLGYIDRDSVFAFPSVQTGEVLNPIFQNTGHQMVEIGNSRASYRLNEDMKWERIKNVNPSLQLLAAFNHPQVRQLATNADRDSLFFIGKEGEVLRSFKRGNGLLGEPVRGQLNDSIAFWASASGYTICNLNQMRLYRRSFQKELGRDGIRFARLVSVNDQLQITGAGFVAELDEAFHMRSITRFPEELKVHYAFIDLDETIWMASFNKGIYKFPKSKREIKYSRTADKVSQFSWVDGKLIASLYDRGFYRYDPAERDFEPFIEEEGYILSASEVKPLASQFYLTGHKVITYKNGQKKVLVAGTNGLKLNNLGRQLLYHKGFLYGNYSGGINKIHPETLKVIELYEQVGVYKMILFKDHVYLGTPSGLKVLSDNNLEPVQFGTSEFDKPILNLKAVDSETLLITTDGYGAYLTNMESVEAIENTDFLSVQDAFVEDDTLWLATDRGVWRFDRNAGGYALENILDESDGMPTRNINAIGVFHDQLVVGTDNGIAVLPKDSENKSTLLDLYFEEALFNNKSISPGNSEIDYEPRNNASFIISNIDYSGTQESLTYSYKLQPIQDQWISTQSRSLNFTDLQPEVYVLQIKSGEIEKSLSFEILPSWWQKKPVQIVGWGMLVLGTVFMVYFILKKNQMKQTQKLVQEKRLAQIQLKALRSQMNPHFVFNSLAAIQYYINNNDFEASETYLVKFSKLIRKFFELSEENEITIAEEISLLKNYLDLEKLRFRGKFDYQIHLDPSLNGQQGKIPAMLLQPIVENAVNHGIFNKEEKGNVTIDFQKMNDNELCISIIDDGVGFANTQEGGSRAKKSSNVLQDRLYFLNRSLRWQIDYKTREAFPELKDKGNISTFTIKRKS